MIKFGEKIKGEIMASFQELIESSTPVLVDFYADWCGPCKMISPIIKEIASEMKGKVQVVKIDVDRNQQAAAHFQIKGVPTIMLFKEGKILWRQAGVVPKQQIIQILNQHISN